MNETTNKDFTDRLRKQLETGSRRVSKSEIRRFYYDMVRPRDTSARFGTNERTKALQYAVRMSSAEKQPYVLFYDYYGNDWMSLPYNQFVQDSAPNRDYLLATEDLRFILPYGEILHW